jgi:hypothetical protein
MPELGTAIITVVSGVIVYILGQILQRFILEPLAEQRKVIAEVAFAMTFYVGVGHINEADPEERLEKLLDSKAILRTLAGRLRATVWTIPFYNQLAFFRIVRRRKAIFDASTALIGFSNALVRAGGDYMGQKKLIDEALNFHED